MTLGEVEELDERVAASAGEVDTEGEGEIEEDGVEDSVSAKE